MDKYKCIIVDDQAMAIQVLESYVKKMPQLALTKTFQDSPEALEFLKENSIDLVFLDIRMPKLEGLKLIENLRLKVGRSIPSFILTTGYEEYALPGYEQGAIGYLVKPIIFKQFKATVERLIDTWNKKKDIIINETGYFFIETEGAKLKLKYKDIAYLECKGNYIMFIENNGKERSIYNRPMRYIETILSNHGFLRVHKSFIVSADYVQALKRNKLTLMIDGKETIIPIGEKYKWDVQKYIPVI